ncbi:hypothetical protein KPH14_007504 [Odynerus spinipes]|uniref:Retrovirus-related Pol polyprotein from transposon TNT 1-94-like beta-barrel domain-containing protein n=1 Tax=Odynerus spinipes TaxID=1348599 RepID=A0AAD9REV1_9HYME|nr:hypothetical protein KPH14_007504 [Odynerus spinipes]
MSASLGSSTRIELLNKDNYDTRCMQAEARLIKNDGWEYANGNKVRPAIVAGDATTEEAARAWDVADRKAKSDIILSVNTTELKQIRGCHTAYEVWDKLRSIYASRGPAKKAALFKKLTSYRMIKDANVHDHINNFIEVVHKLGVMGIDIHKDLQSAMLLNSLPDTYENFRCAMESRDELPELDVLKVKILKESESRKQKHNEEPDALNIEQTHKETTFQRNERKDKESGCTTHICKDRGKFVNLHPSDHMELNLASHASTKVEAKGNVSIEAQSNNNIKDIEFQDALYAPDLRVNLVLVAKITEKKQHSHL